MKIEKIAVIGSGVMGSGIAAHIANAGLPVLLLDIVPQGADNRNMLAEGAIARMLKTDPAPFMDQRNAKLITPGNLEDDLEKLNECDWIIEVVLEDLKVKHQTYEKIAAHRKKGAIVSSNTSTIPLEKLVAPFDEEFARHFMITHFFNPPRYMRLLELVTGEKTDQKAAAIIRDFCDIRLGKGVVPCHDTPGFIANRLGVFWLQAGINEALKLNIPVDLADAVMSRPVGIPKTGVFGLIDLVGIDLMPHLAESLLSTLPEQDAYRTLYKDYPFIAQMIEAGYTGRKGKGGFYRLNRDGGKKEKQALSLDADNFSEAQYRKAGKPQTDAIKAGKEGLRAVVSCDDPAGRYAWAVLSQTLHYAASLVPEIADNIKDVDEAMKLGYNWKSGPFEMIDALGAAWFAAKLEDEGETVPPLLKKVGEGSFYKTENGKRFYFGTDGQYHEITQPDGVLLLRDIKLNTTPLFKTQSASLWDVGDGVLCVEFTGKMNTMDEHVFAVYHKAIEIISSTENEYKALVVYNEGSAFSAGANLGLAMFAINIALWEQVEKLITGGQETYMALKYAPFPVVAAPSGLALGGGCEILLHVDHVQAHAELYTGLVEVGVGLIPAWGGCKEMILRYREQEREKFAKDTACAQDTWFSPPNSPMTAIRKAFETIGVATVAKSAQDAKTIGYLKNSDAITMNRDRLLYDAKQRALALAENYQPPAEPEPMRLPGESGKLALDMAVKDMAKAGKATPYDIVVCDALTTVLSGGENADWTQPLTERDLLELEVREFSKLLRNEGTMARITHMLETGKPLRN